MPNEFTPPTPPDASPVSPGFGSSVNEPAREKATRAVDFAVHQAAQNPWPILLGALAVGVVVGIAVARRDTECEPTPAQSMERWLHGAKKSLSEKVPAMRRQLESQANGHSLARQARNLGHKLNLW